VHGQWMKRVSDRSAAHCRGVLCAAAACGMVLGAAHIGIAQGSLQQPLTLNAAVDLALRNHPAVREARAGSRAASGEIAVARTAYLPRLDFLWQANRATRNNVFGLLLPQPVIPAVSGPVLGTETLGGVWSTAGGLLLSWEAVAFGRRSALVDVARADSRFADAERSVTELDVASAAADAVLQVLATEAALGAARANVERLEIFATTVRTLVENQLRAGAERSRAEAELAAARRVSGPLSRAHQAINEDGASTAGNGVGSNGRVCASRGDRRRAASVAPHPSRRSLPMATCISMVDSTSRNRAWRKRLTALHDRPVRRRSASSMRRSQVRRR
jgi:hypothetical protein